MSVAENIVRLRKYHRLTQNELSKHTGINRSVLSRIEKGTRPVRDDELEIFADYFNVTTDYLFGRKSKIRPLSETQKKLLGIFESLNDEGQSTLMNVLISLELSASKQNTPSAVVQKNSGGTNFLAAGSGNNYHIVTP